MYIIYTFMAVLLRINPCTLLRIKISKVDFKFYFHNFDIFPTPSEEYKIYEILENSSEEGHQNVEIITF